MINATSPPKSLHLAVWRAYRRIRTEDLPVSLAGSSPVISRVQTASRSEECALTWHYILPNFGAAHGAVNPSAILGRMIWHASILHVICEQARPVAATKPGC